MNTRSPTSLQANRTSEVTLERRRKETLKAVMPIHGGTRSDKRPALDGIFDTLNKRCKTDVLGNYILTNDSLTNYVIRKKHERARVDFENSETNTLRSIATYYTAGVMGKRKYQAVRLASSMKVSNKKRGGRTGINFLPNCPIPKLITYNKLAHKIRSIDIGKIYNIEEKFSDYLDEDNIQGHCRDLIEYLPRLAKFYLQIQNTRKDALKWFGQTEGTMMVALGGDGCPFGKNESACSFLVSFLNTGKRVASSSDNFLIFGANCQESSLVVRRYVQDMCYQMAYLEGKIIEIDGLQVTFKLQELPNDMKMLAMLAGEVSNAATYFSTFGNVSKKDCTEMKGTFGNSASCKWKPWAYNQRVNVATDVEALKSSLNTKHISDKAKRSKITDFIAKKNSRQEYIPIVGEYVNKAHVEPLHLKNNAWQYFFKALLKEAVGKSDLPSTCKIFTDVPRDSCLGRVVTALQYEVKTTRLARKVKQWFDETQGKQKDMQYRFTGKESRSFCHNFMRLIKFLSQEKDTQKQRQAVLVLAYIGLRLRDCCSIFSRFEIMETDLSKLKKLAKEYFRANALFVPSSVNPTIWTLGHVLPVHAEDVYTLYGQGLLTVTMEGREAKHIALKKLSENTTYQQRWLDIFRHEYIMLVWLPEQGHEYTSYSSSKNVYIPQRIFTDPNYCYCGLAKSDPSDQKCYFCGHNLMKLINDSVQQGKIMPGIV